MILLIDNYDSFTYNLVDYFEQLGVKAKVYRNDVSLEEIQIEEYRGVVFSPGPGRPENAGNLLNFVAEYLGKLPILGICLGHQAIAMHLGAKLVKAALPMHGKISKITISGGEVFKGIPNGIDVVRYHSLVVQGLAKELKETCTAKNGELMSYESVSELKAWGLQFHPEAVLTQYGLEMLRNWVTFYNIV